MSQQRGNAPARPAKLGIEPWVAPDIHEPPAWRKQLDRIESKLDVLLRAEHRRVRGASVYDGRTLEEIDALLRDASAAPPKDAE